MQTCSVSYLFILGSENGGRNRSRARAPGSMGGDVPEKYYVVRNNDMIRVKYLLVYVSKSPTKTHRYLYEFCILPPVNQAAGR